MAEGSAIGVSSYDVIIVGGGHNGLVAAAYLGRAKLRVLVVERRAILGGPCGTYEFLPGYRCAFSNSPGSLEPRIVEELELDRFGLKFIRTDPTVAHSFLDGWFIGWRDRRRVAEQLDAICPGESDRYFGLIAALEDLGAALGVSLFSPPPDAARLASRLSGPHKDLFTRLVSGSLSELLDDELKSRQAKALLGMVALNATFAPPSASGTAIGLILRPISLASSPRTAGHDPRAAALRGSTGLPIGGMGAIVDALVACCRRNGVAIHAGEPVSAILHKNGRVTGVLTAQGREYHAPLVVTTVNPKIVFGELLDDGAIDPTLRAEIAAAPMRGSAFKLVLALRDRPSYRDLPTGVDDQLASAVQLRVAASLDYIERAVQEGLSGRPSTEPLIWALMPSVTSSGLAAAGRHLLSANIWHAPRELAAGDWASERETFGERCIDFLARIMPNLRELIVGRRFIGPDEIETELTLPGSNITHGDMLPGALFGARPHSRVHDCRTPLGGLYISGAGVWPGGYVTGAPGYNVHLSVLADLRGDATKAKLGA